MSARLHTGPARVARLLDAGAADFPAREALVDARHRLNSMQLHELVRSVATGLRSIGLRPGDRVAVSLPNSTTPSCTSC